MDTKERHQAKHFHLDEALSAMMKARTSLLHAFDADCSIPETDPASLRKIMDDANQLFIALAAETGAASKLK